MSITTPIIDQTTYVPGVCNINTSEVNKRKRIGYYGLAASVIIAIIFLRQMLQVFTE